MRRNKPIGLCVFSCSFVAKIHDRLLALFALLVIFPRVDKKSLFRRHGHPPAGTGLNERFHGGNVAESGRWRQVRLQTRIERIQDAGKTAEMQ